MNDTYMYYLDYSSDIEVTLNSSVEDLYESDFRSEIHDCITQCLSAIGKEMCKALQEVCGSDLVYADIDDSDIDLYQDSVTAYITLEFNSPKTEAQLKQLMAEIDSALEAQYEDEIEFQGRLLGYERGWNYPDTGGPPIYSDETCEITVYLYLNNLLNIEEN